jgi:HD superfamily phosphohydrolase YqeK
LEDIKKSAYEDLNKAYLQALSKSIIYVIKKGILIHPYSVEARNNLLRCLNNPKNVHKLSRE